MIDATRRQASGRSQPSLKKILEAADAELRASGCDGFTVRRVAKRAGVSSATAYTYFASRDHLIGYLFHRRLSPILAHPPRSASVPARLAFLVRSVGHLLDGNPPTAVAFAQALVASGPDVAVLRADIGRELREFTREETGFPEPVLQAVRLACAGAVALVAIGETPTVVTERLLGSLSLLLPEKE